MGIQIRIQTRNNDFSKKKQKNIEQIILCPLAKTQTEMIHLIDRSSRIELKFWF